ncbi:hypothetical protein DUNSADRAFT_15255 [Dunaliella salina]|uniref:DNA2/NAM7 helicase helicase domain-containing protein n=1 Tax=Dunaliella salina TaxID=3046 RepID=A0ABQ7H1Z9_DUNSA|nr:hypothetical protein DUNSADRAFT_15255 [Dunaliella salina]|eukprot:KAF5840887.1 hypothetical protein DUNSADRAFT_15255 [Dunaliella salina]
MMEFRDDPVDLLFRLTGRQEDGERQLRTALSLVSEDPHWVSRHFLPFLSLLGVDALGRGAARPPLLRLLCNLFNFPGMLEALSAALQGAPTLEAAPEAPAQWSPVGWFLLTVATESTPARAELSSSQQELGIIIDKMQQLGGPCAKAAEHLQVVLGAGGRHSNDSPDFRAIKILPTPDEALSSAPPHIPSPHPAPSMPAEAALLDRQFRLMREDFVGPVRAALAPLQQSSQTSMLQQQQQQQLQHQRRPQASSSFTSYRLISVKGSRLEPRPCVLVQVQLPPNHPIHSIRVNGNPANAAREAKDARTRFWSNRGKGTLPADALVCIVRAGKLLGFAMVAWRTVEDLAAEQQPVVGLMAPDTDQLSHMLQHIGANDDTQIVQELNSIQSTVTLDPSQARVLEMALTQRVALIQGPPGTGKTFTGVLLVESLLRCSTQTILVVCYTNHALDQFLEALLNKGIEQIVRVGGRSRSRKLEPKNLRELARNTQAASQAERRQEWRLRQEFEELKAQAQHLNSQQARMLSTSGMALGGQSELRDAMAGTQTQF